MKPQTIFITGATDGIGLALAQHYHQAGHTLRLLGRRPFDETPLAAWFDAANYCRVDLAQPDCGLQVAAWLSYHHPAPRLDMLLHNAAVGHYGPTPLQSAAGIQHVMAVNLRAPLALSHRLLPYIKPGGKIVFISSVVSALACPEYAVYGASKAALDGLARNLRLELAGRAAVQVIYPGATRTGMHAKSGISRQTMDWEKFPPAEQVAAQIAQAAATRRPTATIGGVNRLLRWGGLHLGNLFDAVLRRRYRKQPNEATQQ